MKSKPHFPFVAFFVFLLLIHSGYANASPEEDEDEKLKLEDTIVMCINKCISDTPYLNELKNEQNESVCSVMCNTCTIADKCKDLEQEFNICENNWNVGKDKCDKKGKVNCSDPEADKMREGYTNCINAINYRYLRSYQLDSDVADLLMGQQLCKQRFAYKDKCDAVRQKAGAELNKCYLQINESKNKCNEKANDRIKKCYDNQNNTIQACINQIRSKVDEDTQQVQQMNECARRCEDNYTIDIIDRRNCIQSCGWNK